MLVVALFAALQTGAPDPAFNEEGLWLGRLSTAVALCSSSGYAVDERAARAIVNDFQARASQQGWSSPRFQDVYAQGQRLERADMKLPMALEEQSGSQARRLYRDHRSAAEERCLAHSQRYPTVISRSSGPGQRSGAADGPIAHPAEPQQFEGRRSGYVQGTLNLALGERAVMRPNANDAFDLVQVDRIDFDDVLPPPEGSRGDLNQAPPGTVRFSLHARQDVGSLLKVENGQDIGLKYTAFVVRLRNGRAQPPQETSVCTVPPGMVGFERWPEPVVQIVIARLEQSDDALPVCPPAP